MVTRMNIKKGSNSSSWTHVIKSDE